MDKLNEYENEHTVNNLHANFNFHRLYKLINLLHLYEYRMLRNLGLDVQSSESNDKLDSLKNLDNVYCLIKVFTMLGCV